MKDKAHDLIDIAIENIEKELLHNYTEVYNKVKKDLEKTLNDLELLGVQDLEERVRLLNRERRLTTLIKAIASDIQDVNRISTEIVTNNLYECYGLNYEFGAYLVESGSGYDLGYNLFNRNAIKKIVTKELTPFTKMAYDGIIDKNIIVRDLTRELTQAIMLGESINKTAKRVKSITEKNMNDSIRIARTEMNRVENQGRQDAFKRGEELGLKLKKKWISTIDQRTRNSHQHLNLEMVDLDKPYSNGLLFPGSPNGVAREVVNCRCTQVVEFVGLKKTDKELKLDEELQKMSFEEWRKK